jgi:predicted Holliday junction resolvase-like endonuclease
MKKIIYLFLFLGIFNLTGCFSIQKLDQKVLEKNQQLSEKAQQELGDDIKQKQEDLKDKAKQTAGEMAEKTITFIAKSLTDSVKKEIDQWLETKGLNQYGDPKDTVYAGGSPLFDETTGESKDKYEYILEKNPELVTELGL